MRQLSWALACLFLVGCAENRAPSSAANHATIAGTRVLFEADMNGYWHGMLDILAQETFRAMERDHIAYADIVEGGGSYSLRVPDPKRIAQARAILNGVARSWTESTDGAKSQRYEVSQRGGDVLALQIAPDYRAREKQRLLDQSVDTLYKRIRAIVRAPVVVKRIEGDRIEADMPGFSDTASLKKSFDAQPRPTLRFADGDKKLLLSADRVLSAASGIVTPTHGGRGSPFVDLFVDAQGAQELAKIAKANAGRKVAIVVDGKAVADFHIHGPMTQIVHLEGDFTQRRAADLAALLESAAHPPPFKLMDIGPAEFPR
jgi:preprotein translocase subunit SecD